jgi:hypothetical protein
MRACQVINEWLDELVDQVISRIEPFLGDYEDPDMTPDMQRERVQHVMNTGQEPDYTGDAIAENIWTLAMDAAHDLGCGESASMVADRVCTKLGYPRKFNADALAQLRKRFRQKSDLGAALRALQYKSFAHAVNDLDMGEKEPKDIEQDLILRALSQNVKPRRGRG